MGYAQSYSASVDSLFSQYEIIDLNTDNIMNTLTARRSAEDSIIIKLDRWELHLGFSKIIADDYFAILASDTGNVIRKDSLPQPMHGRTKEGDEVSITFNFGFIYGFINDHGKTYNIEPLYHYDRYKDRDKFILYENHSIRRKESGTCGTIPDPIIKENIVSNLELNTTPYCNCNTLAIALASDYGMMQRYGSYFALSNRNIGILNDVQTLYDNEFTTFFHFLVYAEFFSNCASCDPWYSGSNGELLLNSFASWGNQNGFGIGLPGYNLASLWTTRNFHKDGNYNVIGLATIGGICSNSRYNILEAFYGDEPYNATSNRTLQGHEMGHNFNADHDASGTYYIMAPSVSGSPSWSAASKTAIQNKINANPNCFISCQTNTSTCVSSENINCEQYINFSSDAGIGEWNSNTCSSNCGKEQLYIFRPSNSGNHILQINSSSGNPVNYSYKLKSNGCNQNGFTCIGTFSSFSTTSFGPLIAGMDYYILADPVNPEITSQSFRIMCPPECTYLSSPFPGSINIPISTNISWSPAPLATGYKISIGTVPGGTDIINNLDVGYTFSFDPPADLPSNSTIYIKLYPYRFGSVTLSCTELSFSTICSSSVSNTNDSDVGSLRQALLCPSTIDTIRFNSNLLNKVIVLTSGPLVINKNIVIRGMPGNPIKIMAVNNGPVFSVSPGFSLYLENVELFAGINLLGRAISNKGTVTLKNVTIYDSPEYITSGNTVSNTNAGQVNVPVSSSVKINNFQCGQNITVNHYNGDVAPVTSTITYPTALQTVGMNQYCWITKNLGAQNLPSGAFDNSSLAAGWYWQFNRKQGYAITTQALGESRIPQNWNSTAELNSADWSLCNDPCAISLGTGWRIPSSTEWQSIETWNDITQAYNSSYKIHAGGSLNASGGLEDRGESGSYWNATSIYSFSAGYTYLDNEASFNNGENKSNAHTLRCIKSINAQLPSRKPYVITKYVDGIDLTKATVHSSLTCEGNSTITNKGVCYSTNPNPVLSGSFVSNGPGNGDFISNLTSLTPLTTYYLRAFAFNAQDTMYGNELQIQTYQTGACGSSFVKNHVAGNTAPVTKSVTYATTRFPLLGVNKCWIKQNLGADHSPSDYFDDTEASAGWYWQFNRKQGYKHDGNIRTPNTTWINSISEFSDWVTSQDPCNLLLGSPWRIPTNTEWTNASGPPENWEDIYDAFGSDLLLHTAGDLNYFDGELEYRGIFGVGHYWSKSTSPSNESGYSLNIGPSFITHFDLLKSFGFSVRCVRDISLASVTTTSVTAITHIKATLTGQVTANGESPILQQGFCYNTSPNPTINNSVVYSGYIGLNPYSINIVGLSSGTLYYVKAFVTTADGTSYGNQLTFTTLSQEGFTCGNTFTVSHFVSDISPETKTVNYATVLTNLTGSNKCWIKQNLGASNQAASATDTAQLAAGWYWQFNLRQGYKHNGVVRTPSTGWSSQINASSDWTSINDPCLQEFGPGWRLPTSSEWSSVISGWTNLSSAYTSVLKIHAGGYLPNLNALLYERGQTAYFWSSNQINNSNSFTFKVNSSGINIPALGREKTTGMTLRCLRDISPSLTLDSLKNISSTSIHCKANVTNDGGSPLLAKGICYATTPNPTLSNQVIPYGTTLGIYNVIVNSLLPNTTYYFRAYATNVIGTTYSNSLSAATQPLSSYIVPFDSVNTYSMCSGILYDHGGAGGNYNNNANGYTIVYPSYGTKISLNGSIITQSGFDFVKIYDGAGINGTLLFSGSGTTSIPTITSTSSDGALTIQFTSDASTTMSGFTINVQCTNSPVVQTQAIVNLQNRVIRSSGNIPFDGGTYVSKRGICFDTLTTPNMKKQFRILGSGMGSFYSDIGNLNPATTYYFRAFAITGTDTTYGNQVSYLTPEFFCGDTLWINHIAGNVAPENKSAAYKTVTSSLTGASKCWITQNLGSSQQASSAVDDTEASAGWYWQFNRKQGFKHDGTTRTPNTTWISFIDENFSWLSANDPCRLSLGSSWRLPTNTEWTNVDGPPQNWGNATAAYASVLKIHNAGFLPSYDDGNLANRGISGLYWSNTMSNTGNGYALSLSSSSSAISTFNKSFANSVRCIRDFSSPAISLSSTFNLDSISAFVESNLTSLGGLAVTARGICFNTSPLPTISNSVIILPAQAGSISTLIPGLLPNTTYYVRAYATNSLNTTYSNQISFTTYHLCGTVLTKTHTAGNVAPVTKTINYLTDSISVSGQTKCWLAQNLGSTNVAANAFDATEDASGWYWQFNKKQGFKHDGSVRTPSTTWISAISEHSAWQKDNDPCYLLLLQGWRIPTFTEYYELDQQMMWNSVSDAFNSDLHLHAGGYLASSNGNLINRGTTGIYFSSTGLNYANARSLFMQAAESSILSQGKTIGSTLRCLRD